MIKQRRLRLCGIFRLICLLNCFQAWMFFGLSAADTQVIPAFDPERYQALWSRSPFGIDTAPVAVPAEGPSFAENLVISGIVRNAGQESILLLNTRSREFDRASADEGGKYELVSLQVDRDRRKSWAMIRYQGETAEVRFPEQKTAPVGKLGTGPAAPGRQQAGAGPSSADRGAAAAGRAQTTARAGGASPGGGVGSSPSGNPPRRRVILPRKR